MKKTFTSSFLGLAISGLLLASCSQMASYENEDLALEQARADKEGFTLSPYGNAGGENAYILEEYVDCEAVCIEEDGTYFYVQTAEDYQNGESVTIITYNTLTEIVYEFTSTTDLVSIAIDGGDLEPANGETIYSAERRFPLAAGWSACDLIDRSFTVRRTEARGGGAGVSVDLETSYNLVGICTTTELVESTVEPLCIDDEYTITATVTSSGAFMGGIIQILDESNTVVASAEVTETIHSVDYLVPTGSAGTYNFTAQYLGAGSNGYNDSASEPISVVIKECNVECNFTSGTGYVGDTEGENSGSPGDGFNNAWWYAFDITGDATQDVYENGEVIGSATYDVIAGTISINFNDGYSLKEGESESVKWYSYADGELPTAGRPIPGQAPDDNKGNSLVINTNGDRYYVIHLDFQKCNLPSPE